jgi:hypothetical protein
MNDKLTLEVSKYFREPRPSQSSEGLAPIFPPPAFELAAFVRGDVRSYCR